MTTPETTGTTTRVWRLREIGEPIDRLRLEEDVAPQPGPGEVAVDVDAVGLSFPDVLMCRGEYQMPTPDVYTPGGETAGGIAALGEGVDGFEVGQRVVFFGGGLAERVVTSASSAFVLPDAITATTAAAIPMNYATTWFALHDRAKLEPGEWLLVTGAAGGTGTAAIQLGLATGARIVAVAGGETKAALARDLGADVVIDHHVDADWVDAVREATGGGVDVAYDPVGGDTFHQVRRCMAWDGRLLVIGFVAGIPDAPMNHVLLKNYSIVGVHWGASIMRDPDSLGRQMTEILALAETGAVDPPLYPPYPFDDAAQALQDLADRKTYGKVVVEVPAQ